MNDDRDKIMEEYSQKVLPPTWSPLTVQDDESLAFLGTGNLRMMLKDWDLMESSNRTMLNAYQRMISSYGPDRYLKGRMKSCREIIMKAQVAKKIIKKALKDSDMKPVFVTHRDPFAYFSPGDAVFTCLEDRNSITPFFRATVIKNDGLLVRMSFLDNYGGGEAIIGSRDAMILHEEEMRFLVGNRGYLGLFSKMCDFDEIAHCDLFVSMIEDCGMRYFPEIAKLANDEPDVEIVDSLYANE